MILIEYAVERRLILESYAKRYGTASARRRAQQIGPEFPVLRRDLQMKMQAVLVRVNLFRVNAANNATIQERNKFRRIVFGRPLCKMVYLHTDNFIEPKLSFYADDFRQGSGCVRLRIRCAGRTL